MNKRISFILASIHGGMAPKMWKAAISAADLTSTSLFFFPGGRLNCASGDEYLRNGVYDLAGKNNFDGLIAWTSTLAGTATPEEVQEYMKRFSSMPAVTIGLRCGDLPLVNFDAYQGMFNEVSHFIKVHHSRRIAFIRGPEFHISSEERFKAYVDCLQANGIAVDYDLVSSPRPWDKGREALEELVKERGLVPGIDFDSLICASDMMLYGAAKYLEKLEVEVPGTLRVGGFNDSDNNKLLPYSISTVRMPIAGMTRVSLSLLDEMLRDPTFVCTDVNLPADFLVRSSCGCDYASGNVDHLKDLVKDEDSFISWTTSLSNMSIDYSMVKAFTEYSLSLQGELRHSDKERFTKRFEQLCSVFFSRGGDPEDLLEIVNVFCTLLPISPQLKAYTDSEIDSIVMKTFIHYTAGSESRRDERALKLSTMKTALLSMRSIDELGETLCSYLPGLGFRQAYLVLDTGDDSFMRLSAGYDRYGRRIERTLFSSVELLPENIRMAVSDGAYVVEPLATDSQALGYLVLEVSTSTDASMLEDIRSSVSSALKGISLLDMANKARESAEKAERNSSEFYANVSEELREPLESLRLVIEDINTENKSELMNQIMKAENLLDLILSERGESELEKQLILPSEVFPEYSSSCGFSCTCPQELPMLYADAARLKQVFSILSFVIAENDGSEPSLVVSLRPDGLCLTFSAQGWKPALLRNNPSLILAEKIVVMHSGTFRFREQGLAIVMPWPTLSGAMLPSSTIGYTLYIKRETDSVVPEVIRELPQVTEVTEDELAQQFNIPDNVCQIAYDAKGEKEKGSIILNLLRNHQKTKNLPFLCFGLEPSTLDLWSALETSASHSGEGSILVLGTLPEVLDRFSSFGTFVFYEDKSALLANTSRIPSMVILNTADSILISELRKQSIYAKVPFLVIKEHFVKGEIEAISQVPNLLIVNTCILSSDDFVSRLIGIFGGNELLPPLTGALVKCSIAFLNEKATTQLSRWQLADAVNISEDYLTRIFRRDMGISPWEYLNRYRIQLACELLTQTGYTINEIASRSGFQDQAYFCRVFKKIKGFPPGHLRSRK